LESLDFILESLVEPQSCMPYDHGGQRSVFYPDDEDLDNEHSERGDG